MLYIWKGNSDEYHEDTAVTWHKGDLRPLYSQQGGVMTFQADGDELFVILAAIDAQSHKGEIPAIGPGGTLNPEAFVGLTSVEAIKAVRAAVPALGLADAKTIVDAWEARGVWRRPEFVLCLACNGTGKTSK